MAERIIDLIESNQLNPRSHKVCRRLAGDLPELSDLSSEVIYAFDEGKSVGNKGLSERLWAEIDSLPLRQQGSRRILVALLSPDEAVDFHLADYLIQWSESEGISDAAILTAFEAR